MTHAVNVAVRFILGSKYFNCLLRLSNIRYNAVFKIILAENE